LLSKVKEFIHVENQKHVEFERRFDILVKIEDILEVEEEFNFILKVSDSSNLLFELHFKDDKML
jgi:hypothetical protein